MSKSTSTTLISGIVPKAGTSGTGFTSTIINPSGDPHANAQVDAAVSAYRRVGAPRPWTALEWWHKHDGSPVALLLAHHGMFGAKTVTLEAGRIFISPSTKRPCWLPTGKRSKGFAVPLQSPDRLLDVEIGRDAGAVLRERLKAVTDRHPLTTELKPDTFDALPERAPEDGNECRVALFGSLPFVDGPVHGAIWLFHSFIREDKILEGVLIVPPSAATSEHGSTYLKDLDECRGAAWGVVALKTPIRLRDALALCNGTYEDALARIRQ